MIELTVQLLKELAPAAWRIEKSEEETAELFFVKRQLDTRRLKDVSRLRVTVFRDDEDGSRGFTAVDLTPGLTEAEIRKKLEEGYYAAAFAMNPGYRQPDPVQAAIAPADTPLMTLPLSESAGRMAAALLAGDDHPQAFLNSAEIFVIRTHTHILSSEGTDVSWSEARVKGEFVAQCREPEDVEIYKDFEYDALEEAALTALVRDTLAFAADRARAQKVLASGEYDLVLTGDNVREILDYYLARASAYMIYPGYSSWQRGTLVQPAEKGYESLDLSLQASAPFSSEGIPMKDRVLLDMGVLKTIPGVNRFCRYLDTEPTGEYRKIRCDNEGSCSLAELKKGPCLWAVTFSDFQLDPMSGYFGGEIRLAYLIGEDGSVTPVTGGSVSASILETQGRLLLSQERFTSACYEGPEGIRFRGVSVAGSKEAEA
ncbi:MAG: hypothetical protein J5496_03220 [Lachnospiraceae bacterium]|nr:hypothetical protein [Lachnospiraceae bacterium]